MLLYDPQNFEAGAVHVAEYSKWYHTLEKKKLVSAGEELADKGWLLSQKGGQVLKNVNYISGQNGKISGFFIINAASENEAMAIATTCPHLKYNGAIEVRPVEYH